MSRNPRLRDCHVHLRRHQNRLKGLLGDNHKLFVLPFFFFLIFLSKIYSNGSNELTLCLFVFEKQNSKSSKNSIEEPDTTADQPENEVFAGKNSEHRSSQSRKGQKKQRRPLKLFKIDKEAVNRKLTKVSTNMKLHIIPEALAKAHIKTGRRICFCQHIENKYRNALFCRI